MFEKNRKIDLIQNSSNIQYIKMRNQSDQDRYSTISQSTNENTLELPIQGQDDDSYTTEKANQKELDQDILKHDKKDKEPPKRVNIFAQKHRKNLMRFLQYSWENKKFLIFGNIGLVVTSACQISLPYLTGRMVDVISTDKSSEDLTWLALAFVTLGVFSAIFSFVRGYSFNILGEKVMLKLRSELFDKFVQKDVEFYDVNKSGELMSRITSDTAIVQSAASDSLSILLRNIIQFIGSFIILWIISYELTMILFIIVPPLIIGIAVFIRLFKKYSKLYQDKLALGNSFANEAFGNIRVVKSFAREQKESQNFYKYMQDAYVYGEKKSLLHGSFLGIVTLLGEGAILCVLWYGGKLVLEGKLTTGQLSSFILYTITLSTGLLAVGGISNQIITAVGVSEKLFEMMDVEISIKSGVKTKNSLEGNISFENVTFEYPTKKNVDVLKNVNFEVKQGQVVALVGSSGSGKSSTVSLIQRFYDVKQGLIKLDNIDIKQYNINWVREQIGYVSQEPTLFSGTLKENIVYGVNSYTQQDIDKALEMANAKQFVYDTTIFPDGLNTLVGERGVKLSGGQKQRIAIARALIKNPRILIFDEATSALDAESEYQVQKAIDNLMVHGQKTIIVIAHRLSTIKTADTIIVIQDGEVKEIGNHKQLLSIKDGFYTKLIQRQISGADELDLQ
ncbi:ABC-type multidrug transport system, ATPase and permease component (macronuclear) [Tetrahymena thermophila SB210]|uniref:ABC-type multidrug transport system, ATPase and permease component n=1 Tax=Tetrahymena thermophila (strain SB210) TaxID=312017 RepID=I7M6Q4_TETTS|nr:ABC-type multidrug transport system, ATPase and permease component [Tetrahymena thermophila SB210]EAR85633.2 ABC-type multidrug transport system, ATPase and permease component [Tetrahymena thermophila SB210]|eukprot:XP_001033296.2 ABC-type multidrug transport system, ATPase and permease component [Tetrahymena thermophila SB210]